MDRQNTFKYFHDNEFMNFQTLIALPACIVGTLVWITASLIYGTESCTNQMILCSQCNTRQEVCNNALCSCSISGIMSSRYITCIGVLSEIPFGQLQESLYYVTLTNNNITEINNQTFSGLSTHNLNLKQNRITTIETAAFEHITLLEFIDLSENFITVIGRGTFNNLPYLNSLYLNNNLLKDIQQYAFNNLPKLRNLYLYDNLIVNIEQHAFINLPTLRHLILQHNKLKTVSSSVFGNITNVETLHLAYNDIAVIENNAFNNVSITSLLMYTNPIEEIPSQAFQNIFNASHIILSDCPVNRIKSYAFSHIKSDKLEIVIPDGLIHRIEQNAFYDIAGDMLVLGVSNDMSFEENLVDSHFNNIYFIKNSLNCNCTMMWIALWLQDGKNRESIRDGASCNDSTDTPIANLTLDYFSHCIEMPDRHECRETEAVIVNCSLNFVSGNFIEWIHSRNGIHIRTLKTLTNILSIPFCSLDDIGDYTCVRSTLYSIAPFINTTTTLHVKGKPVVVNRQTHTNDVDIVLSVTIYTTDDVDIQWLLDGTKVTNDTVYMIKTSAILLSMTQYNTPVDVNGIITNLTLRNYNSLSTRAYTCRITNEIGIVEQVLLSRPIDIILHPNTLCDTSSRLEVDCTLNAGGAIPKYFKHTVGGKLIRTLTGLRVNNTYTLVIPFCNSQDQGEYTCYWETGVSGLEVVSKTTTLNVKGPPIIQYSTETAVDEFIILSVMFLSHPYPMEPQWYFNDVAIVPSSEIQQTTSTSLVEMKLHRVTAYVNGFMSNLTIKEGQAKIGDYKCVVKNGYGTATKIITRYEVLSSPRDKAGDLLPVVVGSVAAGVTIVVIIIAAVVFVKWRQQKLKESRTYHESTERSSYGSDTYDSIRMSSSTTEQDYIDVIN